MIKSKSSNCIITTKMEKAKFKIFIFTLLSVVIILSAQIVAAYASPATVNLGSAGNFVILAKTTITTTGTTSIVGDIGVSPNGASSLVGFAQVLDPLGQFSTSSLVNGRIFAADYSLPTPTIMSTAISDMQIAYTDAAGRIPNEIGRGAGTLNSETFVPGVYKWTSPVTITGDIYISGGAADIWIFQIDQTFNIQNGKKVILIGGAKAENIFWQIAGQTTLYPNSVFNGIILDQTGIAQQTGATLNGRALAQSAVTLDANNFNNISSPINQQSVLTNTTLLPPMSNLTLGSTLQLNLACLDQFGLPMAANISYNSSNSSVAIVNSTGFISTVALGNATINATCSTSSITNLGSVVSATSLITVDPAVSKSVPIMDGEFLILLIVSTLILGLYAIKRYGR
jgi:hypothetical protein